ncbi:MAG: hypothetical protein AAB575_05490 [Patescibacteria group bacterium]
MSYGVVNKMKLKIISTIIFLSLAVSAFGINAAEPAQQAFIKYQLVGWQTYEFYVVSNFSDGGQATYEWNIDDKETFNSEKLRYFFPKGEHSIKVKVSDEFGNAQYDTIRLLVSFWSLRNNWFWWTVYFLIILIILYYWTIKLIYLFNRRRVCHEVRRFMDALDEHGLVEQMIEAHLQKQKSKETKKQ